MKLVCNHEFVFDKEYMSQGVRWEILLCTKCGFKSVGWENLSGEPKEVDLDAEINRNNQNIPRGKILVFR